MGEVLILGGYGNFGQKIAYLFAKSKISFTLAGRSKELAEKLAHQLKLQYPSASIAISIFDIYQDLAGQLDHLKPKIVINTCGPFQNTNYHIAETCIKAGVHYIDLADARDFVQGITFLNKKAKAAKLSVISGASTVPGLSSAVLEKYKNKFLEIDSLKFGISPGQKSPRGIATTKAILTYVGKKLRPPAGCAQDDAYGWQNLHFVKYPQIGMRPMGSCDIPDLDLFPARYGIKSIHFAAGMESKALHFSIWALSWLARSGLYANLAKHAKLLWKLSFLFDWLGTENGGMHMIIKGVDKNLRQKTINWFIIAKKNHGPYIPAAASVILAKKILSGKFNKFGAFPCMGIISLEEYMKELEDFDIKQYCTQS